VRYFGGYAAFSNDTWLVLKNANNVQGVDYIPFFFFSFYFFFWRGQEGSVHVNDFIGLMTALPPGI